MYGAIGIKDDCRRCSALRMVLAAMDAVPEWSGYGTV